MNYIKIIMLPVLAIALLSCQDDDRYVGGSTSGGESALSSFYPVPPSQWMGASDPYFSAGYTGDIMPYFDNGTFHIYFLHDAVTKPAGKGFHDIHEFTSTDLANFKYEGQAIPYGTQSEPDFAVGTGSVVKAGNTYYFYYTGHNGVTSFIQNNARESVLCATSTDLKNWTKIQGFKITAPGGYYNFDFRDPHVFFNDETGKYNMIVSTQTEPGRKAVLLLFTSTDPALNNWEPQGPIYTTTAEDNYLMMECADVFKMGNYWYLMFSENWSGNKGTHYRMATSINGPWVKPAHDMLDGEYFYAAKTAFDGTKRYAFAWTARKAPESDTGDKVWGGNMVIHELTQNGDGTLGVKSPNAVSNQLSKNGELTMDAANSNTSFNNNTYTLNGTTNEAKALFKAPGSKAKIKAQVNLSSATGSAGFLFNIDDSGNYYKIVFEPAQNRIAAYNSAQQEVTHVPFDMQSGTAYNVEIITEGSICVVYVNGKVALSNRIYGRDMQKWGLIANGTTMTVTGLTVAKP
jgi:beta-fructofuranosidase